MIDLHMHSRISDGSYTVDELIKEALTKGLKMISITDHDTHYDWSHRSTETLSVMGGLEVSAYDYDVSKKVHLLLYGNQLKLVYVNSVIKDTLSKRHLNSTRQLKIIREAGYEIDESTLNHSLENILYKQHIMEALKNQGYTDTLNGDLYIKLFKNNGIAVGDIDYPNVMDVIQAARRDKAFVVLAHPGLSKVFNRVPLYVKEGLQGIETYHGLSSLVDQNQSRLLAKEYNLIETIGSDFHGIYGIEPAMGDVNVPFVEQEKLYQYFKNHIK